MDSVHRVLPTRRCSLLGMNLWIVLVPFAPSLLDYSWYEKTLTTPQLEWKLETNLYFKKKVISCRTWYQSGGKGPRKQREQLASLGAHSPQRAALPPSCRREAGGGLWSPLPWVAMGQPLPPASATETARGRGTQPPSVLCPVVRRKPGLGWQGLCEILVSIVRIPCSAEESTEGQLWVWVPLGTRQHTYPVK